MREPVGLKPSHILPTVRVPSVGGQRSAAAKQQLDDQSGQRLAQSHLKILRQQIEADGCAAFTSLMDELTRTQHPGHALEATIAPAISAGFVSRDDAGRPTLTQLGWRVGDSFREYVSWQERGRTLCYAGLLRAFDDDVFRGKRVLDIGCGAGCNLLVVQEIAEGVTGVEIEPVYAQMAPILAEMAGMQPPPIHVATAEDLPIGDATQDVVMALGSFQFMEFDQALREFNRVLVDDGIFIAVLSPLDLYIKHEMFAFFASGSIKRLMHASWDVINTVHEGLTGQRLRWLDKRGPMYRVVYPTRRRMRRALRESGFIPDDELTTDISHERIYVARNAGCPQH